MAMMRKRDQENAIDAQAGGRHEQKGADRIHGQADHHAFLVTQATDDHGRRQGRTEIADIESELGQAGAGAADIQRLLEMMQQQIVELRCQAPGEEQGGSQRKRHHIAFFNNRQSCHSSPLSGSKSVFRS